MRTFNYYYFSNQNIKKKSKNKKRRLEASNEFTEDEVNFFVNTVKDVKPYPKLRDLRRLLTPKLSLAKINAILKFLERSKRIIVDLDGNIVWFKENNMGEGYNLYEVADFSKDFTDRFGNL